MHFPCSKDTLTESDDARITRIVDGFVIFDQKQDWGQYLKGLDPEAGGDKIDNGVDAEMRSGANIWWWKLEQFIVCFMIIYLRSLQFVDFCTENF